RILDALLRETTEETGLETVVRRFLAHVIYRPTEASTGGGPAAPLFHTFAFLLDETGGTLGVRDKAERIEGFTEIDPARLGGPAANRIVPPDRRERGRVGDEIAEPSRKPVRGEKVTYGLGRVVCWIDAHREK